MKRYLLFVLCIVALNSCQTDAAKQLEGTWENTSLTVTIKLDNGTDSTTMIAEGNWESMLGIKPIVSTFNADGTFTSEYFKPDGTLMGKEEGTWRIKEDSLILNSTGYDNAYKFSFEGDMSRFVSYLDWDQDGKADDLYDGWQKKISKD